MYSRFVHFFPSLPLPPLPTRAVSHLAYCRNLWSPCFHLAFYGASPFPQPEGFFKMSDRVTPLLKVSHHVPNKIQPLSHGLPSSRGLSNAFLYLTLYPNALIRTQESGNSSFFLCSSCTSIVLGTCQVCSCLRAFALALLCDFNLLPDLPVADSIMSFRSQFSYCLFKEIAPTIISPFSHFLYNITIWNFLCFYILSLILEIKLWENEDLVCPFHFQAGAQYDG